MYFFEITSLCEIISLLANMIIFHVHVCTNLHVHVHDHVRGVNADVDVDLLWAQKVLSLLFFNCRDRKGSNFFSIKDRTKI